MAKNKHSKKQRKAEAGKMQNMKPEHLIALGDKDIEAGHFRNAISLYKQALKNNGNIEVINLALFRAYLLRGQQLLDKGMAKEADATFANAMACKPDLGSLSEADILLCINTMDEKQGVELYSGYCSQKEPLPSVETLLAGKLLKSGNAGLLKNGIYESSRLKDHLDQVLTAVDAMNGGQWEEALNHLKPVPRSSPWSDLKLFCKAMTHFAKDEGPSVIRSLSQLSDSFPFPSAVCKENRINIPAVCPG